MQQILKWKSELLRIAIQIAKRLEQRRWTVTSEFCVERELFYGFYISRKIIESPSSNESLKGVQYEILMYPFDQNVNSMLDRKHILNKYQLFRGKKVLLTAKKISSKFIHSSIVSPFVPIRKSMAGVYFCSYDDSEKGVHYIRMLEILEIFLSQVSNSSVKLAYEFGKDSFCIKNWSTITANIEKLLLKLVV
jgi:hypothetical protein